MFDMLCLLRSSEMDLGLWVGGWARGLGRGWGLDFWDLLLADREWLSVEVSGFVYEEIDDSWGLQVWASFL
jgi:hypothetical protein